MRRSIIFLPRPRCSLRKAPSSAVMFTALFVAGCGTTCISGFFNPGGQINISTGNAAPACALPQTKGAVGTAAAKLPKCESCTPSARVEHLYVTLRGVQLHPNAIADQNSPDWVEITPQLADEPRQIDLIGSSEPEILAESTMIAAGSYGQVRLEFLADPVADVGAIAGGATDGGQLPGKGACGATLRNCIVMGDGRVDPILWPGDVPEILITGENAEGGALVVLPDTMTALRIRLEPQQVFSSSDSQPWVARVVLVGHAQAVRPSKAKNPDYREED